MTMIETIAALFGLLCVWLTVRQNIWCWPAGLVQVALYIWIFFEVKLYSDMALHVVYVGLGVYGWWYWLRGGRDSHEAPVTRMPATATASWAAAGLCGAAGLGWLMGRYTDASLPYWDAAITMFSLIAQWLMARKRLESWAFWITVDVVAIGVYITKELYVTSGLYAVFLGLAIAGWFAWQRSVNMTSAVPAAA